MTRRSIFAKISLSICACTVIYGSQACQSTQAPTAPVNQEYVEAGTQVKRGSENLKLYPGSLKVGDNLNPFLATLGFEIKQVSVVNFVPSIDTKVCEEQTHVLGETELLKPGVTRITISRDLPFAQERFAEAAKLTNITYLSDYKQGAFGKKAGLLIQDLELLARGVMVTDKTGKIHHLQIVSQIGELPDMEKAFQVANQLISQ